jgi:hypothetical protein
MRLCLLSLVVLLGFSGCSDNAPNRDEERQPRFSYVDVALIEEDARIHGEITDAQIENLVTYIGALNLEGLTELPVGQAEKLCRHKCGLSLGLTTLTDPLAESLSGYQGIFLGMRNLRELTDNQARSLAEYRGMVNFGDNPHIFAKLVSFQGVPELKAIHETVRKTGRLTDPQAESLIQLAPISCLYLTDLVSLTDRQAEILGSYKGGSLFLDGLNEFTDDQAENLAAYEGNLYLKNEGLYQKVDDINFNKD